MRSLTAGLVLGAAGPVLGLSPLDTFYPPTLNQTSYISNASIGTYGGIYKAPTNGPTGGNPYGTYDYCSMPHPRTQEYKLPGPIANGSVKGELVYLEYLQRHQRRSPYNILPGGEVSLLRMSNLVWTNIRSEPSLSVRQCSALSLCWRRQREWHSAHAHVRSDVPGLY
jgi:acid phosphatase